MTFSASDTACPEKKLLALCARTRMQAAIAEEIRALATGPLDWNFLFAEATENSVVPLLAKNLIATAADLVPVEHAARLKETARANALRCLALTAELIKIADALKSAGVPAIPYKGPVLAVQAYGDLTLREFADLDIVLRQRDMAKADEIVAHLGYRPKLPAILGRDAGGTIVPADYAYRDEARGLLVELHTEMTLRHFPAAPDIEDLASRLTPVTVSGHEIPTFAPEDMFPILCIHGAKHFWERLSWVSDIAELSQSLPGLDWDTVFRRAERLQAGRMLRLGLALASGGLGAPLPPEVLARVRGDRVAASVARDIERRFQSRESLPLSAAARFHLRREMVEGISAGWKYSLRLATLPAEEDLGMARLPRPLSPLYAVLRPFRLLQKYGLRPKMVIKGRPLADSKK